MEYKNILFAIADNVATITFNRPKALNAMNAETVDELGAVLKVCRDDEAVKAILLTGAGEKAFVAGADIAYMQNLRPREALLFMEQGHEVLRFLETMAKPSVAAINGFALGGGLEISLACDVRIASEKAVFGQPEMLIGLIPGWGGTQRLPRLIGMGLAKELILAGGQISAQRAYEVGLVNKVVAPDQLLAEAGALARTLAGMPAFAIKMAKHSINFGYDMALDNANRLEMECIAQCFSTDDQKEGMRAFLEKRKPVFTGH